MLVTAPASVRRMLRPLAVGLVVLLFVGSGALLGATGRGTTASPASPDGSSISSAMAVGPAYNCSGPNNDFSVAWNVVSPSPYPSGGNNSWNSWIVGPAPLNVTFNVTLTGEPTIYNYYVGWGVGANASGAFNKTTAGPENFSLAHFFPLPAVYLLELDVNYSCSYSTGADGGGWGIGGQLTVYGPAGPTPLSVTADTSGGTVPIGINYTASILGAPANATAVWTLYLPIGAPIIASALLGNATNFTEAIEVTVPGPVGGTVSVYYPASALIYATADLPEVSVAPLAFLSLAHTNAVGPAPWNTTWWANATNLTGAPMATNSSTNGTVEWTFPSPNNASGMISYGEDQGSPVWRVFEAFPFYGMFVLPVYAALVLPDGVTLGDNWTWIQFTSNGGGGGNGPGLILQASPSNGTAPFSFDAVAAYPPALGGNLSGPLTLTLGCSCSGSPFGANSTVSNWSGLPTSIPGTIATPGLYVIWGEVLETVNGSLIPLAAANTTVQVFPAASSPSLSFSASPTLGSAPMNVTVSLVAVGGTAPYDLTVCTEGPFTSPNGTGTCIPVGSLSGWTGATTSMTADLTAVGNYTIVATIVDSVNLTSTAVANVVVVPSAGLLPLTAHASFIAPNALTTQGATYGFQTTVAGGLAPYNIQWSFGDGSSGSAVPGGTVLHTYTTSGTFTATLTVTDALGHRASSTVGPLVVVLPPSSSLPWWASNGALAVALVLGVASAVVLGIVLQRGLRRREALNWLEELRERRTPEGGDRKRE